MVRLARGRATVQSFLDLHAFIEFLRREGELAVVQVPVDPRLEVAEIHRRVIAAGGPALLFENPAGSDMPLVTNLFGTRRRAALAFGPGPSGSSNGWPAPSGSWCRRRRGGCGGRAISGSACCGWGPGGCDPGRSPRRSRGPWTWGGSRC
jgi:3-polyprenyl-4-hydroxybenzoate decarboxylase and related decarboxylases